MGEHPSPMRLEEVMGRRMVNSSICMSRKIEQLEDFEECFFIRLLTNCDDYGRCDARPEILKAWLYPIKKRATEKTLENALKKLVKVGLVYVYEADDLPIVQVNNWEKHQTIRNKRSKYPDPICSESPCNNYDNLYEFHPDQSPDYEPDPDRNQYPNEEVDETIEEAPVIGLLLKSGKIYNVSKSEFEKYAIVYGASKVNVELQKMKLWLEGNPTKRKTKDGMMRFISSWLSRNFVTNTQASTHGVHIPMTGNPFADEVMS